MQYYPSRFLLKYMGYTIYIMQRSTYSSVEKQWGKAPEITIVKFTKFAIRMAWPSEYR